MICQLDFLEFQVLLALFDDVQSAEGVYVMLRTSTQSSALFSTRSSRSSIYRVLNRLVAKEMLLKSKRRRPAEYLITAKGRSTVLWHYAMISDLSQDANTQAFSRAKSIPLIDLGEYDFMSDSAWIDD